MRPKKYDQPRTYPFKCEDAVLSLALEKARTDGRTLPDVLNDFLNAYTTPNTTTLELERQIRERGETIKHENIELEALKLQLKQKTGEIPSEFIEYYRKKRKVWTEEQRQEYIKQTSEKLKCGLEWLREKLEGSATVRPAGLSERPEEKEKEAE